MTEWPPIGVKYKNNHSKQWGNISITQQIQNKVRMDKNWKRLKRILVRAF